MRFQNSLRVLLLSLGVVGGSSCVWFFAPTSLDGLAEAQIRAFCHFTYACCTASERATYLAFAGYRDEGACVQEQLEEQSGNFSLTQRAKAVVDAGEGTFNQERAEECTRPILDAMNNCDAEAVFQADVPDGCSEDASRGFVEGNVKDGKDCTDSLACEDFGDCILDEDDVDDGVITVKGECKARAGKGDDCGGDDDILCQPGLFCNADEECEKIEKKDDGEECFSDDECDSDNCEDATVSLCSFDNAPCDIDEDCANFGSGETCDSTDTSICVDADKAKVEICDGLGNED